MISARSLRLLTGLAAAFMALPGLLAQSDPVEEEQYKNGLLHTGTYSSLAGLGSVNLYNGGFTLAVPLFSLKGRAGHDVTLAATYNSKQVVRYPHPYLSGYTARFFDESATFGRWKVNIWPQLQVVSSSLAYFATPDGAVHRLAYNSTFGRVVSSDGSLIRYTPSTKRVEFLDGSYYDFSPFDSQRKVHHVDANGNRITYEFEEYSTGGQTRPSRIVDTLGRVITFVYSSGTTLSQIRVPNHQGVDLVYSFGYTSKPIRFRYVPDYYGVDYHSGLPSNVQLLSSLQFPNGQAYSFQYDHVVNTITGTDYGTRCQITSLVLPTGAVYTFSYDDPDAYQGTDLRYDRRVAQYLDSVSVDPIGGGAFTTDYAYLTAYPNGNLTRTQEVRADGSILEVDWYGPGSEFPELREIRRVKQGTTALTEVSTTWQSGALGTSASRTYTWHVPSNTYGRQERTLDAYGLEVQSTAFDYRENPSWAQPLRRTRRWHALDIANWRLRVSRVDETAWNAYGFSGGREEFVVSSTEYGYDEFALTDRGTVVGHAPGFGPTYTNRGNLTTVSRYLAGEDRLISSHTHYDTLGNVVKTADPLGRESTLGYSASTYYAYPTSATNPLGHSATTNYDFETGLPLSTTDANGQTTAYTYDAYNRRQRVDFPDGSYRRWTYDDSYKVGKYRTRVNTLGSKMNGVDEWYRAGFYDGLGRLVRTQQYRESGQPVIRVDREYALCGCTGRTSRVSMPYYLGDPVYWTETRYDALGRVTKVIPPDGTSQQNYSEYVYGFTSESQSQPRKRVEAAFDAKGIGGVWRYDAVGALLEIGENADYATLNAQYWTTVQAYPLHGTYTVKQVQWQGQTLSLNFPYATRQLIQQGVQDRRYEYDFLGRPVEEMHPEHRSVAGVQGYVTYSYDDASRLLQRTDPRGIVTTTAYDGLNRPLTVTHSDGTPTVTYTYDQGAYGIGRLSSVSNAWATSTFSYDPMGRVLQESKTIDGIAKSHSFSYNVAGLPVSETLPNGITVSRQFDRLGRITGITSSWVDANHPALLAGGLEYAATGALTSIDYGNGTTSRRSYTPGGLLKTLQHGNPSNPGQLADFEYHYDEGWANNGRIMRIDDLNDPTKSQTYGYDALQRLISAETDGSHWGLQWSYDRYGNRLSQTATKGSPPIHTSSVDELSNRVTTWSYDQAGNVLDDGSHTYSYDADNKIVQLDSGAAEYRYDGQGNRVMKVVGSTTTRYFWGHEFKTGWTKLFVRLGSLKLAEYSGNTTRFFHADQLGSPRVRTDMSGTTDAAWDNLPFGETWASSGTSGDQHRYTGHLRDAETGNDYAGARYYASRAGRWLAADSVRGSILDPQSTNRYRYVRNDPVNLVDPDGRHECPYTVCVYGGPSEPLSYYTGGIGGLPESGGLLGGSGGGGQFEALGTGTEGSPFWGGFIGVPIYLRSTFLTSLFYRDYGESFANCMSQVFGSPFDVTGLRNRTIDIVTDLNEQQIRDVLREQGIESPDGPFYAITDGRHTIYINSDDFNQSDAANYQDWLGAVIAHETANLYDIMLTGSGYTHGDPNDSIDDDTGMQVERCMFDGKGQTLEGEQE